MELALLFDVQYRHGVFQMPSVFAERPFDEAPAFRCQLQQLGAAVNGCRFTDYEAHFLDTVNSGGHGSAGEQDLRLNLRDGQRPFVQEGLQHHEIAQAKTEIHDAALHRFSQRPVAPRQDNPELSRAELVIRAHRANCRSTESAPAPLIIKNAHIARTSKWNSYPSPFCVPVQLAKKPNCACTVTIATSIFTAMPNAATRVSRPRSNPNPPKNSAAMARKAKKAGMCIVPVKKPMVPENP